MAIDRAGFTTRLQDSYEKYYDVVPAEGESGLPLLFTADFHARDEGYVLVKSAKIWAAESNEYVYAFGVPVLTADTAARCLDYAVAEGEKLVSPHRNHKESYIIAVFVADVIEPDAEKLIRSRKFDRSFKLGIEGWMALKTAAADLEKELVVTNKAGTNLKAFFKKLLRSEKV